MPAAAVARVVNIREIGWPKGQDDVYIGRPSQWANPYHVGKDGDRDEVLAKFRQYFATRSDLHELLPQLAGKRLFCFCCPLDCHGDVLIEELKKRYPHLA